MLITINSFNNAEATASGFPEGGTLTTVYQSDEFASYQLFNCYISPKTLKRKWNTGTSSWSAWVQELFGNVSEISIIGSVSANSSADFSITSPNYKSTSSYFVTPVNGLNAGIIFGGAWNEYGNLKIRLYNITGSAITLGTRVFKLLTIDDQY
jgi:hypothetical protein